MRAGIAGAGLLGRLLALELLNKGWQVSLFDRDDQDGQLSCAFVGAGMLAPLAESIVGEHALYDLGTASLSLWPELLATLSKPVYFQQAGTLLTAHRQDQSELDRCIQALTKKLPQVDCIQHLSKVQVQALEPELRVNNSVFHLTAEGQISNTDLLPALADELLKRDVVWYTHKPVTTLKAGTIICDQARYSFDMVFDCRGLGAKADYPDLRGVRGELIWLHAPDVNLQHPIRLLHPRYPLYIVPRPDNYYIIGASQIESEDFSPISLQTTLELLSAAYSLHPGFAEARLVKTLVNCRPAYQDNLPRIHYRPGLMAINGLYRHGYLLAPALLKEAWRILEQGIGAAHYPQLVEEIA